MNISINDTAAWLNSHDNYLVLTHIRPDGDTLGCGGALVRGLRELGKTAYLLCNIEVTERYAPFVDDLWAPDDYESEYVIAVDTATPDLLPKNAAEYLDKIELCIDHHGTNTGYARQVCCLPDYASCGEIIYEILEQMFVSAGKTMSAPVADRLYVAVSTDTGCFAYGNTTANTHSVAARIIELGADSKRLNKMLFRTKRRARILIEGMVNSGIEYFFNNKVAFVTITREMMDTSGATEDDIDDIANIAISVEGVVIGITIREMSSPTDCKISVRTTADYDASQLCTRFGGGGHKAAAGATIAKTVDEVKSALLSILEEYDFQ